jgi:GNAT superfamily N-acetyltransferase
LVTPRIERVPAEATWPLRRAVLRPHEMVGQLRLADAHPSTTCFGAVADDGTIIGTSMVVLEDPPFGPGDIDGPCAPAWRLRGMATAAEHRGSGIGTALLDRVIAYVGEQAGAVLWCNARVAALALYERAHFRAYGDRWDDPDIGPHVVMWRPTVGPTPRQT